MWTHVDRGDGGQKRDFFVDVINEWPHMYVYTICIGAVLETCIGGVINQQQHFDSVKWTSV